MLPWQAECGGVWLVEIVLPHPCGVAVVSAAAQSFLTFFLKTVIFHVHLQAAFSM
jgi:hypothetical protein